MAGVTRTLTGHAVAALFCLAIWGFGLAYMWVDQYVVRGVWRITGGQILLLLAMALSVPVLIYCGAVFLYRRRQGLPAFSDVVDAGPEPDLDPLDPSYLLSNPPADAQVTRHGDRRVVVLADGSAIGEMLNGSGRRFPSLEAYRAFVGS